MTHIIHIQIREFYHKGSLQNGNDTSIKPGKMQQLFMSYMRHSLLVSWVLKYTQFPLQPTSLESTHMHEFLSRNNAFSWRLSSLIQPSLGVTSRQTCTSSTVVNVFWQIKKASKISPFDSSMYSLKYLEATEGTALFTPIVVMTRPESASSKTARAPAN